MKTRQVLGVSGLAAVLLIAASGLKGQEIGFLEDFSLAKDRSVPLKQLIPGTEDYYYYHCLHYQHTGQLDQVRELLVPWIKRHNVTERVREIQDRQALLEYKTAPAKSLDHIRERLKLRFDHQKQIADRETHHATQLDKALITYEAFLKRALAKHKNLNGVTDSGLDYLDVAGLDADRRRHFLERLQVPDYPGLPKLVVDDLKHEHSRGFGSFRIHSALVLSQLDACIELMPDLLTQTPFINAYLPKLHPDADVTWEYDLPEKQAYLERLWTFVRRLPSSQNSLKAHVLYQQLAYDQSQGTYNRERFIEYLKLPRQVPYIRPEYVQVPEHRNVRANLGADFRKQTLFPPIGRDEELVRDYLAHFLQDTPDYEAFAPYVEQTYLKELFAETKIVNGIGDMEQWYSLLPPAKLQQIKERVDIDWLPVNPAVFATADPVKLRVAVKNVPKLIAKVYEINTRNYYSTHRRDVTTAIDLDGLVANDLLDVVYEQAAFRRHMETFAFPHISRPGVYVVELIGNGKSSRTLVRKGRLSFTERVGAAGHIFRVYNDDGALLRQASLLLDGHQYACDQHGEITVPFSTKPEWQQIVLLDGDFAALHRFYHTGETYELDAAILADRESLIAGQTCRLVVRPRLTVSGVPIDIGLLEKVKLSIASTDSENIPTTSDITDIKLSNDSETVHEFRVPETLRLITFRLSGEIRNISRNKSETLSVSVDYALNAIDATEHVEDLHVGREDGHYILSVLGKTGESKDGRPVNLTVKHRDFADSFDVVLQSDGTGRLDLGALPDIEWVRASLPGGTTHTWTPCSDLHTYPAAIHALAGEDILVPLMDAPAADLRTRVALLEVRAGTFVRDVLSSVEFKDGFLSIRGLTPGDYELRLKREHPPIPIRVTAGQRESGSVLSKSRYLKAGETHPLQISAVTADATGEHLVVRLANVTPSTRVTVVATRFLPGHLPEGLLKPGWAAVAMPHAQLAIPVSLYLSGRSIGDEYRYILERAYARKYPGNLLARPGLLLNPWSLRKTEAEEEVAEKGEAWDAAAAPGAAARGAFGGAARDKSAEPQLSPAAFANYDFLPGASPVLTNLKPDEKGEVRVPAGDLADRQHVHVIAVSDTTAAYRQVSLPLVAAARRDRTLRRGLASDRHFTEQKKISLLAEGKPFVIEDMRTSSMEIYDALSDVYALFSALSGDATLAEFMFILNWPELPAERKRELYSTYACHELSFFLAHKDPEFFTQTIRPYLACKKDKTFVDLWLLEGDLSAYLRPWSHARLNAAERILLGRRVPGEAIATARHIKDLTDLLPPDVERFYRLFDTAIKAGDLEESDSLGDKANLILERFVDGDGVVNGASSSAAHFVAAEKKLGAVGQSLRRLSEVHEKGRPADRMEAKAATAAGTLMVERSRDGRRREAARQFYQKLDTTEEWVENNYYHLPVDQQSADLIRPNAFWADYATHDSKGPFISEHVGEATGSFAEMMFALAVLDLPFKTDKPQRTYDEAKLTLTPAGPTIAFHKEIRAAREADDAPLLVSQNFFAHDDRYRHEGNERFDKFITREFRTHRVYGCQVVLTNPTSSRRKVEVLLQIPMGAMPVLNGFYTKSVHRRLDPYSTQTVEYYFYFPEPGDYAHYPVHVAQNEEIIAAAEPFTVHVVDKLTLVDKTSWSFVSQNGSNQDVLDFLAANNIDRLDLSLIAFRMKDADFFAQVIDTLQRRHVYADVLWSYAILHDHAAGTREYLRHSPYATTCGLYIATPLLTLDPVSRHSYEHKEYSPLVNPRVYPLGKKRKILNRQFYEQYCEFLKLLSYRPTLQQADLLGLTYYLLLQDRVEDALATFARVNRNTVAEKVQYDYLAAYTAFYRQTPNEAKRVAGPYADYPVDRWRHRFRDVLAQLAEIEGKAATVVDQDDRSQSQTQLADTEPVFDFQVEGHEIKLQYRNLTNCRVNLYAMDIELVFSRNPFVQDMSADFSVVRPNHTLDVDLPARKAEQIVTLPPAFRGRNVMIEIVAAGATRSVAHYPHSLDLQITENYGQLRVADHADKRPLPKVYVKVYARMQGGDVQFYKDGYTDLRGRFDYTSLNTGDLDRVEMFAILIASDEHGAVVRTAKPPKR